LQTAPLILALLTTVAMADTVYVNGRLGSDAWDGRCEFWDGGTCGPKATIQAGLDAGAPGDCVLIANGNYTGPGNKNLDFAGKPLTLRSASGEPATCVIDCAHDGRALYFHSGEGAASVVQGLMIRGASGDTGTVYCYNSSPALVNCVITGNAANNGGGLFCEYYASPTLTACRISNNFANCGGGVACLSYSHPTLNGCTVTGNCAAYGAGLWCSQYSSPTLTDCTITENTNGDFGAGLDCYDSSPTLINCIIEDNETLYGGGGVHCYHSSPTLINCSISNNIGGDSAGGIYSRYDSSPTFASCTIDGNTSNNCGGGIWCHYATATLLNCTLTGNSAAFGGGLDCLPSSSPTLINCSIMGNMASARGGGVRCYQSGPALINCIIAGNTAGDSGGGLYCEYDANPTLTNCTLTGNESETGGGLTCTQYSSPALTNCILWLDAPDEICLDSGNPVVMYCDVRDGWFGPGIIDADPLFRDPDGPDGDPATLADNDYRLAPGSPCIDAGDPEFVPDFSPTDRDGDKRIWDGDGDGLPRVDIGAFEFGSFLFGDLNCDRALNVLDIDPFVLALTNPAGYAAQHPDCDRALADINGDGWTNSFDIDPFVELLIGG
jgi:parallel beta-helix repeat protein